MAKTFIEQFEQTYVLHGGFETRAFVRDGKCVRSLVVDMSSGQIVQTLAGERMIDDLVDTGVGELKARGFRYRGQQPYYVGPNGREFTRMDDGSYECAWFDDDGEERLIRYDASGVRTF